MLYNSTTSSESSGMRLLPRFRCKSTVKWCSLLFAALLAAMGYFLVSNHGSASGFMKRHSLISESESGYSYSLAQGAGSINAGALSVREDKARAAVLDQNKASISNLPTSVESISNSRAPMTKNIRDSAGTSKLQGRITTNASLAGKLDAGKQNLKQNQKSLFSNAPRTNKPNLKRPFQHLLQRFPRILIIGFGKAGTRALFDVLKMHPDVRGPTTEKRFFSDHYEKGLWTYLNSLPEPTTGGVVAEKSPDYITDEPVPERITASVKKLGMSVAELRFVVVLRDPIDRAMSEYLEWQISRQHAAKPKLPPFHNMVLNRNGGIDTEQPFLKTSDYSRFIKHWFRYFSSRNQTCFVDGDQFVKDPYSEVHLLETCLHLQPYFDSGHFVFEHKRGFYCFKASINQKEAYCMNSSKGRKHPAIPDKVLVALKKHYQPFDAELKSLTGRTMQWQVPKRP